MHIFYCVWKKLNKTLSPIEVLVAKWEAQALTEQHWQGRGVARLVEFTPAQRAQGYGFSIHKPGVVAQECAPSTDSEGGNPDLKKKEKKNKYMHHFFTYMIRLSGNEGIIGFRWVP